MITAMVITGKNSITIMRNLSDFRCMKNKRIKPAFMNAMEMDVRAPCFPSPAPGTTTVNTVSVNRTSQTIKYNREPDVFLSY